VSDPASAVTVEHIVSLAGLLNERIGLKATADGYQGLRIAMEARLASGGWNPDDYLRVLRGKDADPELRQLLPLVTVGKTEFFRDSRQFQALRTTVLPELLRNARAGQRRLAIWSAGCATGEEPYSLAMLAMEVGALLPELHLVATDVNPVAVAAAREGVFALRRMKGLSPEEIARFFEARHGSFQIRRELREAIAFGVHNLAADEPPPAPGGRWDLIMCRNVFIYFELTSMVRTLEKMRAMLRPGGYLFLGYSESLYRIYDHFELAEIEGAFVYRRPPDGVVRPSGPVRVDVGAVTERLHRSVDLIRHRRPSTSQEAKDGSAPPSKVAAPPPRVLPPQPVVQVPAKLDPAVELAAAGRFPEALSALERSLADDPDDLPARLTLANLQCITGDFEEACRTYETAIALEPLSAEAHALLGVARAEAKQFAEARRELSRAVFLEPSFPLAHYYLGRVAEAGKDHDAARRAYRSAIEAARSPNSQKRLLGYYPDLPEDPAVLGRAAEYALGLVE
jgi:chemotaxis protein methyltransferase CheR